MRWFEPVLILAFVLMLIFVGVGLGIFLNEELNPCLPDDIENVTGSRDLNMPLLPEVPPRGRGSRTTF